MSDTKYINQALGDNAKFYPNYLTNHVASDFKFHLNNGINLIADDNDRMVEEIAELQAALELMILQFESDHNCEYEYKVIKSSKNLLAKLNQEGEE